MTVSCQTEWKLVQRLSTDLGSPNGSKGQITASQCTGINMKKLRGNDSATQLLHMGIISDNPDDV
uniref:Uncharacterized protein n=1 Tax=Romanomermis culicivorax TaxID=13658 RepID=A0A915HYD9_ROMCU